MRIAMVQSHPTVGRIAKNVDSLVHQIAEAEAQGADLAITCELAIPGYASRDLFHRRHYVENSFAAAQSLAQRISLPTIVGCCQPAPSGLPLAFNSALLLRDGAIEAHYNKWLLPTYDVFDEKRYFQRGSRVGLFEINGVSIGVTICEDIWNDDTSWSQSSQRYTRDPISEVVAAGAQILVNLSASPYAARKTGVWFSLLSAQARKHGKPLIVVNQVGADDDLIFVGRSCAFDANGTRVTTAEPLRESVTIVDCEPRSGAVTAVSSTPPQESGDRDVGLILDSLIAGVRDYAVKCKFDSVILGLSGGIDSALTAAIAKEALGPESVFGVALPSRYSSAHSLTDAKALAENLGLQYSVIPIEDSVAALEVALSASFANAPSDVTEENIQARVRGVVLMALSNKHGHLVLNTGNKSELAVGYCTLYGDMCGGLAVLGDVYKTEVYDIAAEFNRRYPGAIPASTMTKPPSAELRPDQIDQDSLPPYEVLDPILRLYVEELLPFEAICQQGFPEELVARITGLVGRNEYKRFQSPPILRVSPRAFGPGRRMPLAAETK